ncbi:gamma-glutamylcyclotransferase family protein [Kaarinaea lacus]
MQRLFVYGTLEFPAVVKKLLGTTLVGEAAELQGYTRYLLVNRNYPGIVSKPGASVDGVLYHGITPKYLKLLDRYEDNIYERHQVQVVNSHGQRMNAWAYVIPLRHKQELSNQPWDREYFASTQLKRFLNVRSSTFR